MHLASSVSVTTTYQSAGWAQSFLTAVQWLYSYLCWLKDARSAVTQSTLPPTLLVLWGPTRLCSVIVPHQTPIRCAMDWPIFVHWTDPSAVQWTGTYRTNLSWRVSLRWTTEKYTRVCTCNYWSAGISNTLFEYQTCKIKILKIWNKYHSFHQKFQSFMQCGGLCQSQWPWELCRQSASYWQGHPRQYVQRIKAKLTWTNSS